MPRCRSPQRPVDLSDNRKPALTREPIQCLLHHLANVAIHLGDVRILPKRAVMSIGGNTWVTILLGSAKFIALWSACPDSHPYRSAQKCHAPCCASDGRRPTRPVESSLTESDRTLMATRPFATDDEGAEAVRPTLRRQVGASRFHRYQLSAVGFSTVDVVAVGRRVVVRSRTGRLGRQCIGRRPRGPAAVDNPGCHHA